MNVAILGATGAVGREMMKILAERSFPVEELRLLASPRSAGQKLLWQGRELTVQPAEDSAFEGMDVVLGAAENDIAKRFAPAIVKAGAVFVDNSSAFRMDPNVPLIDALFEVTSAFGTVGLSTGITPTLSIGSKLLSILIM